MSDERNNTDQVRAQPTSELIDAVVFAIPGSVPTTTKAREIAERVIEIVRGSLASAPPSAPAGMEWDMPCGECSCGVYDARAFAAFDGTFPKCRRFDRYCVGAIHCAQALAQQAQSATVWVEWNDEAAWSLAACAEAAGAERDSDDNGTWWTLRIEHFNALSQQAAAPSGEAVAWAYPDELREKGYDALHRLYAKPGDPLIRRIPSGGVPIYAAPQQPAAVGDAMSVLTELVATLAATGTVMGGRIYFPERQTRELLKKACDALAAQQQGGRADG